MPRRITEPFGESDRLVCERNPYYWKTDPDGCQLPYFDKVVIKVVDSEEVAVLQSTERQYKPSVGRHHVPEQQAYACTEPRVRQLPFIDIVNTNMNAADVTLNQTRNCARYSRIRTSVSDSLTPSTARRSSTPPTSAKVNHGNRGPRPEFPHYHEELAKQYSDDDVPKAEEYLDRAGYSERDDHGYRIRPDGQRIAFTAEVPIGFDPSWVR